MPSHDTVIKSSKNLSINWRLNQVSHMHRSVLPLRSSYVSERFDRCSVDASGAVVIADSQSASRWWPSAQGRYGASLMRFLMHGEPNYSDPMWSAHIDV